MGLNIDGYDIDGRKRYRKLRGIDMTPDERVGLVALISIMTVISVITLVAWLVW